MKVQDVIFLIVFALLFFKHDSKLLLILGVFCLLASIPLFSLWTFFTAERLTWYAVAFFLGSVIFHLINISKH